MGFSRKQRTGRLRRNAVPEALRRRRERHQRSSRHERPVRSTESRKRSPFGEAGSEGTATDRENPEECEWLRPDGYSGFFRVLAPVPQELSVGLSTKLLVLTMVA